MSSSSETKRPMTGRELIARGIEQDQVDRPFAGGESPEAERAAAEEKANRRRQHRATSAGAPGSLRARAPRA